MTSKVGKSKRDVERKQNVKKLEKDAIQCAGQNQEGKEIKNKLQGIRCARSCPGYC
ncbi:hypothetical protein MHK_006011 [Candidatus Magnetomorum sp. HK-1]|nr:hypothetical protein MHK_006011 [Candidatus Magnetomorum sp. HK-1]